MADTHEEQLLSDLLNGIAREDVHLEAAHLESRVMAASFARTTQPGVRQTGVSQWVIAAAVAVAVLTPALFWMNADDARQTAGSAVVETTEESIVEQPPVVVPHRAPPARPARPTMSRPPTFSARSTPQAVSTQPSAEPPITPSPVTQQADEFVPLMPMTAQELTGSFQIVRVQMPRASLGALRSPLEHPHELVEADVLLGEDGMARAIRVSASGSVYPWRSR